MGFVFEKTTAVLSISLVQTLRPFLSDIESEIHRNIKGQAEVEIHRTECGDSFSFSGSFHGIVLANDLIVGFLQHLRERIDNALIQKPNLNQNSIENVKVASMSGDNKSPQIIKQNSGQRCKFSSNSTEQLRKLQLQIEQELERDVFTSVTNGLTVNNANLSDQHGEFARKDQFLHSLGDQDKFNHGNDDSDIDKSEHNCGEKLFRASQQVEIISQTVDKKPDIVNNLKDCKQQKTNGFQKKSENAATEGNIQDTGCKKTYSLRKAKPAFWVKKLLNPYESENDAEQVIQYAEKRSDQTAAGLQGGNSTEEQDVDIETEELDVDVETAEEQGIDEEEKHMQEALKVETNIVDFLTDKYVQVLNKFENKTDEKHNQDEEKQIKNIKGKKQSEAIKGDLNMNRKIDVDHADVNTNPSYYIFDEQVFHGKTRTLIGKVNRHQQDPTLGTAECNTCHFVNSSNYENAKNRLRAHYLRVHVKRELRFSCEQCNKKFGTKGDLHLHNLAKHVFKKCEVCGKLIRRRSFYVHARRHDPNYNSHRFECDICQTKFTTKISLQIHIKTYHSTEPREMFPCNLCKKVLSTKASLSSHVKSVHSSSETKHYCDICGKGLGSSKGLAYHQQLHEEIRPQFACSVCSKTFHYKNGLTIHMKIHKETREHLCSECGKSFTQSGSLKRHFRTHTGERPFSCKLCHDSFNDMSILRRHMILKHKQKR